MPHTVITIGVILFPLLQVCSASPISAVNECQFNVIINRTKEKISCFELMNGDKPICGSHIPTTSTKCETYNKSGMWCIKWPSTFNLKCMNDETLENLNDNIKCANDQKSIHCEGEDKELDNSVCALMSIPWIAAFVPVMTLHWMAP